MTKTLALAAALLFPLAAQAAHRLRSPWDGHPVTLTSVAYPCPAIQALSPDLNTNNFYSDEKGSIIDPARWKTYVESAGPYKQFGRDVVRAADAYRLTGSRDAVNCALRHMEAAAKQGVFTGRMYTEQAYYVQGWVIGAVAIAWLKIRDSGLIQQDEANLILTWIEKVVSQTLHYYDVVQRGREDAVNNHIYWAGMEVAAAGIAANNRKLFHWGIHAYRVGIMQIKPDGSLPHEMRRGRRALHYHLFALAPLVYLAEFGEDNGLDLYAEHDYALQKLVKLSTDGLVNNSYFVKVTGTPQDLPPKGPLDAEQISWAKIYIERFPDPVISKLLAKAKSLSYMYLGGLPPD